MQFFMITICALGMTWSLSENSERGMVAELWHPIWRPSCIQAKALRQWRGQLTSLIPLLHCDLIQVWFQNRRSKERRMKQLSALGARRHAFFRGPRRMRPLGGRLEDPDILGPAAYGYYGGKKESSMFVQTSMFCILEDTALPTLAMLM